MYKYKKKPKVRAVDVLGYIIKRQAKEEKNPTFIAFFDVQNEFDITVYDADSRLRSLYKYNMLKRKKFKANVTADRRKSKVWGYYPTKWGLKYWEYKRRKR